MRRATWLVAIGAALALTSVQSASAESLTNSQQEKMKECNADATTKSLSGDERKAFMKTCLSAAPAKPESKMAMCNKKTAGLAKEERAKAQSECMKAPA